MAQSDQLHKEYLTALLTERSYAEAKGDTAKVAEINAELERQGANAKPPTDRASTRRWFGVRRG